MRKLLAVLLPALATITLGAAAPAKPESGARVHRLNSPFRSAFDAFVYVNRIPDRPEDGEAPEDFAGRIFGRLANQEGRVLLKLPPGMDRRAYFGFKTFLGSEGDINVANCVSCHTPPTFNDGRSHVSVAGSPARATPSLRNLKLDETELERVIRAKMAASRAVQAGAKDISPAYARVRLSEADVPNLTAFLQTLRDVDDKTFRDLIVRARVFDPTAAPAPPPEPVVSGVVRLAGNPPPREVIPMTPESARLYSRPPLNENLLAGKDGGLANVFVYAKRGVPRKPYPVPEQPALIDQRKSMFRPRVQGVRVGQKVIIRNSDPYIHNTRSLSLRNRAFNIGQPPKSPDRERVFKRPEGPIRLGCDFHKWMAAWIFVLDHPFFAVTDEHGRFEIKGLPPGEYTFEAWHEELGAKRATVKVNGRAELNFVFEPGKR